LRFLQEPVKHDDSMVDYRAVEHSGNSFRTLETHFEEATAHVPGVGFSEIRAVLFHAIRAARGETERFLREWMTMSGQRISLVPGIGRMARGLPGALHTPRRDDERRSHDGQARVSREPLQHDSQQHTASYRAPPAAAECERRQRAVESQQTGIE
jgi:hypothetical protein